MQRTTSRVQIYFIEKYVVAQSPQRDYYALRISNNQLSLITWRISHGPHHFPVERKAALESFVSDTHLQDEIFRKFGKETLGQVLNVALGEKDYLPRLPTALLRHILNNLDVQDIIHFSQASKLCSEAVKATLPLLNISQKSVIKIRNQLLGQRKPCSSSRALSIANDYMAKHNINRSKGNGNKCVLTSSLSGNISRTSPEVMMKKAVNDTVPLKIRAGANSLVVNLSHSETVFSIPRSISLVPKSEGFTSSALLQLSTTRVNINTMLKSECSKQSKVFGTVVEKDKESKALKSSNDAKIKAGSLNKRFEVSSIVPEHLNKIVAYPSKATTYKCVDTDEGISPEPLQNAKAKYGMSIKNKISLPENNKTITKNLLPKASKQEMRTCGSGEGDKSSSLAHTTNSRKPQTKLHKIGSSKKLRDPEGDKSTKLKERNTMFTSAKRINKK